MPELNVNTPLVYCSLRSTYLYNGKPAPKGESLIPCVVFAAASLPGRAIGFHCMLHNGALIERLPISAFVHREDAPEIPLEYLELWDCFSYNITCIEYTYLKELRADVLLKDRSVERGVYLFTLDWYGSSLADNPGEGGHKCSHIVQLENGCYAAQPNNRIAWHEPSFITQPMLERPMYETNNQVWSVENKGPKWKTENSDRLFYNITQEEK